MYLRWKELSGRALILLRKVNNDSYESRQVHKIWNFNCLVKSLQKSMSDQNFCINRHHQMWFELFAGNINKFSSLRGFETWKMADMGQTNTFSSAFPGHFICYLPPPNLHYYNKKSLGEKNHPFCSQQKEEMFYEQTRVSCICLEMRPQLVMSRNI